MHITCQYFSHPTLSTNTLIINIIKSTGAFLSPFPISRPLANVSFSRQRAYSQVNLHDFNGLSVTLRRQIHLATPGSNLLRRFSSSVNHRRKKTCSESRFFCGGRRERMTLSARAPCGPLPEQRCLASPGSNLLRRFSSSVNHRRKKTCSESRFFCGGRRERMTLSARAPCGPLPEQRCLASLGSNLLRRFSSSVNHSRKKTCSVSRFFCGGRRERIRTSDPLVPNQLRYQAALLAVICYCLLSFFMNSKKTASKKPFLKVVGERG